MIYENRQPISEKLQLIGTNTVNDKLFNFFIKIRNQIHDLVARVRSVFNSESPSGESMNNSTNVTAEEPIHNVPQDENERVVKKKKQN